MCWDQAPDSKPARATPSPGKFLNINRFFVWYHLANPEHVRISVEISGFSAVRWWMRAFAHWVCDGNPSPKIRTSAYSGRTALGRKFGKTHIKLPPLKKKLTWNFLRWTLEKYGPFDHDRDEGLGIVREPLLIISSDRTEFQSFDGLPSHRRNVFPVNLEPIIEHCSVFPRLLNIVQSSPDYWTLFHPPQIWSIIISRRRVTLVETDITITIFHLYLCLVLFSIIQRVFLTI